MQDLAKRGCTDRLGFTFKCVLSNFFSRSWLTCCTAQENTRTVINHNPLPDITHEDFVSLLGPLLAPENYPENYAHLQPQCYPHVHRPLSPLPSGGRPSVNNRTNLNGRPGTAGTAGCTSPRLSQNNSRSSLLNPNSPAPFDWLHFEGRSVKTTLSNIIGLDGLARERKWRSYCVFSLDVGRKARQGVEAVCGSAEPHEEHFIHSSYVAHSPRGCCVPEQILRTDAFPRLCRLAAYFSIVVGLDGLASCPPRRTLGKMGQRFCLCLPVNIFRVHVG